MSDFDKLITARYTLLKAKIAYIDEFSDFVEGMDACNPEDQKWAKYLNGKADGISAAYSIIDNIINKE